MYLQLSCVRAVKKTNVTLHLASAESRKKSLVAATFSSGTRRNEFRDDRVIAYPSHGLADYPRRFTHSLSLAPAGKREPDRRVYDRDVI